MLLLFQTPSSSAAATSTATAAEVAAAEAATNTNSSSFAFTKLLNSVKHIKSTSHSLRGNHRSMIHSSSYCNLALLGKHFHNDKVVSHTYNTLFCETLSPLLKSTQELRMLEIGFGCGHHNHGTSALMWKSFFHMHKGPGVKLYEIDYGPSESSLKCVEDFYKSYPGTSVVEGIYLGDQGNKAFLTNTIEKIGSSGLFDIIIDDGGHNYALSHTTFEVLWPQVAPGGFFLVEDLNVYMQNDA